MVNCLLINGPRIINSKSTRRLPCSYYIQMKRIPSKFIIMFSSKFNFLWLVGVLYLFWCAGCSNINISCAVTDKEALLKLKDGFVDGGDRLSTWKSEADCCEWSGVLCSNLTGHVIKLDLVHYGDSEELRGNIDSSLCDLQHLTYLNLDFNNFEGSKIPECIGSLGQLRELSASGASIGGTIPRGLQNLSSLEYLDLRSTGLIAKDLEWISHLSSLRSLNLSGVNLSQAVDWQSSLSKAPHLSEINLDDCALISHHVNPASFVYTNSSTSLKVLSLAGNNLDSSILPWLSNVSNVLTELHLQDNALEHIFPNALNINSLQGFQIN
ncbi:receptor-like protein EIX2 [Neltuma alba]|uniref:receptor-like protein EIX2 n=1 Tax=Neltuma alba TaxID=207710 RepID=UPI0010A3DD06|nr:receptor-like protein EIX2 [Prosopis alba]